MDVFGNRANVTIMTFNPFKTTSISSSSSKKSSPYHEHHVSENDSWHSQPHQSIPSTGPLAWFSSGWAAASTTTTSFPPPHQSMPLTDHRQTNASSVSPVSVLAAPASPMIMLRASHSEGNVNTTSDSTVASNERTKIAPRVEDRTNVRNVGCDLPSYPEPRIYHQQQQQYMNTQSDRNTNEKLIEDFPSKANKTLLEEFPSKRNQQTKATDTINNTAALSRKGTKKPCTGESEEAYPGFALYQTARVQYCLGKYNEALDTTTKCLAFQKLALEGNSGALTTSPKKRSPQLMQPSHSARAKDDTSNNDMTALDLRSTFVTGVGRSMLGVVQSISTSDSGASAKMQQQSQPPPHPMLSNLSATVIAQYPLHPCIAQTLLLRGRVLADCGLYGFAGCDGNTDFSLMLQAIRNVEMAVAILRKIDQEHDLATSLALLGTLRTLLGHFNEADRAYEEAISLFRVMRLAAKCDQSHAIDKETAAMCEQSIKRINDGAANVFYRRGKLYQSRRMQEEAFGWYHKSLVLSKCNGANREDDCVRRVVQCMKSRSAMEKVVSAYIDDRSAI